MSKIVLVLGGNRSGKSTLLESCAFGLGPRCTYIATAQPHGREISARITKHLARWPAGWKEHRELHSLARAMETVVAAGEIDSIVLECLFQWTVNHILTLPEERAPEFEEKEKELEVTLLADLREAFAIARQSPFPLLVASSECGLGLTPERRRQRAFRDLLGRVNETAAHEADRAMFVLAGHALDLKAMHVPPDQWM